MSRKAFEVAFPSALAYRHNERPGDYFAPYALAWKAWQAASKVAFREGYEKGVAAFDEAVLLERSKAPAWHDAPNVPGLWSNSVNWRVHKVLEETLGAYQDTNARWYGPIPEDKP